VNLTMDELMAAVDAVLDRNTESDSAMARIEAHVAYHAEREGFDTEMTCTACGGYGVRNSRACDECLGCGVARLSDFVVRDNVPFFAAQERPRWNAWVGAGCGAAERAAE
jgi:hypothetical protein